MQPQAQLQSEGAQGNVGSATDTLGDHVHGAGGAHGPMIWLLAMLVHTFAAFQPGTPEAL